MKGAFKLQPPRPLTRTEAWGCFIANLALPGSGSLVAGRLIGYFQLAAAVIGLGVSMVGTVYAGIWMMQHWAQFSQDNGDPTANLVALWHVMRWPLLGLGVFLVSLLWAALTSWQIIAGRPKKTHA